MLQNLLLKKEVAFLYQSKCFTVEHTLKTKKHIMLIYLTLQVLFGCKGEHCASNSTPWKILHETNPQCMTMIDLSNYRVLRATKHKLRNKGKINIEHIIK